MSPLALVCAATFFGGMIATWVGDSILSDGLESLGKLAMAAALLRAIFWLVVN